MCFALALLCEDFFVAALDIIIIKMDLPPDVAGGNSTIDLPLRVMDSLLFDRLLVLPATFMAAGTSSPGEFASNPSLSLSLWFSSQS